MTARTVLRSAVAALAVAAVCAPAFALDPALRKLAKDSDSAKRSDAARALARDGSPEAARVLVDLLEDQSPHVRDHTVIACAKLSDGDAIGVLAAAAKSRTELTRRNVAEALGRTKSPAALEALARMASKDASAQVRADAIDALWDFHEDAVALAIARGALADRDPSVRAAAAEAAGRIGGEGAVEVVRAALTDSDEGVRCVARAALRLVARNDALAGLAAGAADPGWRTRAQTVDDAAFLRDAPAVDALIALLGDGVLRVRGAAYRAVQQLTGRTLGCDPDIWKAWWNLNRATWTAPQGPLDGREAADDPRCTIARYHGLDVASERAVFVADLSGSMRNAMSSTDARTRWTAAAEELRTTLSSLPDEFVLNLVFFQTQPRAAFSAPAVLAPKARDAAEDFVRENSPGQSGNLLAAMLLALEQEGTDTILLLSDGAPSAGDIVDGGRLRAAIHQRNRMQKRAIHTIGFGATKSSERGFLESLARESGGRAVFRADVR